MVVKLHGDARLSPKNTKIETEDLHEGLKKVLRSLSDETGIIFSGYGGNDTSITDVLNDLEPNAFPWGIYWINDKVPNNDFGKWLEQRNAIWVNHLDFDELMLLVRAEFDFPHPEKERFDTLMKTYYDAFQKLSKQVDEKPSSEEKKVFVAAAEKASTQFKDWYGVEVEAAKFRKSQPDKVEEIYAKGITQFPQSAELLGNYAIFLTDVRKKHDEAETYFKRALDADPNYPFSLANYANFLTDVREKHDEAETYYKRALNADPNHTGILGNYANFLTDVRKKFDYAETYFKRALDADPTDAIILGNYARFLFAHRNGKDGFDMLEKAIELGTGNDTLLLECYFYSYAHEPQEQRAKESLIKLKPLIIAGVRSPGWNLEDSVERATKDGHKEPEFLKALAKVISDQQGAQELDRFQIWRNLK
jgi:Tfp pilus assembly protein PilF